VCAAEARLKTPKEGSIKGRKEREKRKKNPRSLGMR
jgi:hypothetical protein